MERFPHWLGGAFLVGLGMIVAGADSFWQWLIACSFVVAGHAVWELEDE